MKKYSKDDMFKALKECQIFPGDTLLIHSALFNLGLLEHVSAKDLCETLYQYFIEYLGEDGTLLIPTFFYDYARHGTPYDIQTSPPDKHLGAFVQHIGLRQGMLRSINPIFNVSGIGPNAEYVCKGDTAAAFGANSPWDRMTDINAKILGFGSRFIHSCTYMMYVEQRVGSPHMYNKIYTAPIFDGDKKIDKLVTAFVRFLDFNIQHDFNKLSDRAEKEGVVKSAPLGAGEIIGFTCQDILDLGIRCLAENPYFFLNSPPAFRKDEIPVK